MHSLTLPARHVASYVLAIDLALVIAATAGSVIMQAFETDATATAADLWTPWTFADLVPEELRPLLSATVEPYPDVGGYCAMPERRIATVLMLDVVGSTDVAAQLGDARYRELSSRFNRIVRAALKRFDGREEDHAGDGFFATFTQPDRAIRCAAALADDVRTLGVEIRSGIHTGQTESQEGKTHGIAVVIGVRVMSLADAGEIS
jgi:class 3 adenylate cyclase